MPTSVDELDDLSLESLGRCLVTGGGGYVGSRLVRALASRGLSVRCVDRGYVFSPPENVDQVTADICDRDAMERACADVDSVFHVASVVNTLRLARPSVRKKNFAINVTGTVDLLSLARAAGASRFVYTSSCNVAVDRIVENGNEDTPYAKLPADLYTETKVLAEKAVLASNAEGFFTAALRPGGIYGPEEQTHFPRVAKQLSGPLFVARIGRRRALADNTYIDNLIDAYLMLAHALGEGAAVNGQAYFVNDGEPINYFDFFEPIAKTFGRRVPTARVPRRIMKPVASLLEVAHALGAPYPVITSMEIDKVTASHYFRCERAERDFGWRPRVSMEEAMRRCEPYFQELRKTYKNG